MALQTGGSLEALVNLAAENGLSITDERMLEAGAQLEPVDEVDPQTALLYRVNDIFPATALTTDDIDLINEGIDFWAIEVDFEVSEPSDSFSRSIYTQKRTKTKGRRRQRKSTS